MSTLLDNYGRTLEDLFFAKRDAMLIAKQKELERMNRTKAVLKRMEAAFEGAASGKRPS